MNTIKKTAAVAMASFFCTVSIFSTIDEELLKKRLHEFEHSCGTAQKAEVKEVVDYLRNNSDQISLKVLEKIIENAVFERDCYALVADTNANTLEAQGRPCPMQLINIIQKRNNCSCVADEFLSLFNFSK